MPIWSRIHNVIYRTSERALSGKYPYAIVFLCAVLMYCRTIGFQLTCYDDIALISDNQRSLHNIWNLFSSFTSPLQWRFDTFYRPLMYISLLLDAQWHSASLIPYHITNVLIHGMAASLVFSLLVRLRYERSFSLFCALLFAVHPVSVMAVAWVPGRNDTLLAVFAVSAFIYLIDYLRTSENKYLMLHVLFLALAQFTKETAVVLAVLFSIYIHFIEKQNVIRFRKMLAGWAVIYSLWGVLRYITVKTQSVEPVRVFSAIKQGSVALIQYFGKMAFPFNLSPLPTIQDTGMVFGLLALLSAGIALFFARRKRWNYALFGLCWIVLPYIPTLLFNSTALYYEHRSYLSLIGFFIILWEVLSPLRGRGMYGKAMGLAGITVLVLFSYLNIVYAGCFSGKAAFWQAAVARSPGSETAHTNMALVFMQQKEYSRALAHLHASLALNSRNPETYNNLGCVFAETGDPKNAVANFLKALEVDRQYFGAYCNLANYYCQLKQYGKATDLLQQSIRINPHNPIAFYNLGNIYLEGKQYEKAIDCYKESIAMMGDTYDLDYNYNLGIAYYRSGRYSEALAQFAAIAKINPRFSAMLGRLVADCAGRTKK